jgi:hypothetical protein
MVGCSKNAKPNLVGIPAKYAICGAFCSNESMLFDRVLVCLIVLYLQGCLIHNFGF